jgi:hypothetical protein
MSVFNHESCKMITIMHWKPGFGLFVYATDALVQFYLKEFLIDQLPIMIRKYKKRHDETAATFSFTLCLLDGSITIISVP